MTQNEIIEDITKFKMELHDYIRITREQLQRYINKTLEYEIRTHRFEMDRTASVLDDIVMTLFDIDKDLSFLNILLTNLEMWMSRDMMWDRIRRGRE